MAITIRMEFTRQVFSNVFRSDFQHHYFLQDKEREARSRDNEEGEITEEEEEGESLVQNPPQEDGEEEVVEKPFVMTVAERLSFFYNTDSDYDE